MSIAVTCPHCDKRLKAPEDRAGKRATCPRCGKKFIVPPLTTDESMPVASARVARDVQDAAESHTRYASRFLQFFAAAICVIACGASITWLALRATPPKISTIARQTPSVARSGSIAQTANKQQQTDEGARSSVLPQATESIPNVANAPEIAAVKLTSSVVTSDGALQLEDENSLQSVVADAEPSVVRIQASVSGQQVIGSGFIVNAAGHLVTNYHVIEGANDARVFYSDGTVAYSSGWLAVSPERDLAIIGVIARNSEHRPLPIQIETPAKGSDVCALGSPGGLDGTVTDGIVSGIRRGRDFQNEFGFDPDAFWIQTTAPISRGNSGGPLLDMRGRVVGVNTLSKSDAQNINFAVAAQHVAELLSQTSREPMAWAQLPPPRVSRPEIVEQPRDRASERISDAIRDAANKQRRSIDDHTRSLARQAELSRVAQRISDIERSLAVVEAEGTALTQTRGEVMATAAGVANEGRQLEDRVAALRNQLQQLNFALSMAKINNLVDRIAMREYQIERVQLQLENAAARHEQLTARMVALDREARDLLGQIEYKTEHRDALMDELADLEERAEELKALPLNEQEGPILQP